MKVRIRKRNTGEVLFFTFWTILMIGKGLGYTSEIPVFRQLSWAAILFALLKLAVTKYQGAQELILCVSLNVLGLLIWYFSGSTTVLLSMIAITAAKNIPYKDILKWTFLLRGSMYAVRTALAVMGVIDCQMGFWQSTDGTIRVRYGLGYGQPNTAHFTLFILVILFFLLYGKNVRLYHYILILALNFFIFYYTNSRTGFCMIFIVCFLCRMAQGRCAEAMYSVMRMTADKIFLLSLFASFAGIYLFTRTAFLQDLGTFSSRFSSALKIVSSNRISLFGRPGIVTDFGMIAILYQDGIILTVLLIAGYYLMLKRCKRHSDVYFMIACCCYALYCASESYSDSVLMNVTLLGLKELIYRRDIFNDREI